MTGYFVDTADFDPDPNETEYHSSKGDQDFFISQLSIDGNHLWTKTFGGIEADRGWGLVINRNGSGDVYATGQWEVSVDFDPGPAVFPVNVEGHATCIFVTRFDKFGNFIWVKPAGNGGGDGAQSIDIDDSGNIYIAGTIHSESISFDTIILNSTSLNSEFEILIARLGRLTTSTVDQAQLQSITFYPIPTLSALTIDFHDTKYYDVDILLYAKSGQVVYSSTHDVVSGKQILAIDHLPAAMYVLELRLAENRRVKKIIKL
jgi:hypothetical protein